MDNNYRITFVGKGAVETLILDFTDKDIELFDVYFYLLIRSIAYSLIC